LQRELREYAHENHIRLVIVSRDLQVLADSGLSPDDKNNDVVLEASRPLNERLEVAAALQGETNWTPLGSWRDPSSSMTLATPIRQGGEVIGCVLASSSVLLLTPCCHNRCAFAFPVSGVYFGSGSPFVYRHGTTLALPVRRLEEATRQLAAGDMSSRVQMHKRFWGAATNSTD
jgi:hypothetical protein